MENMAGTSANEPMGELVWQLAVTTVYIKQESEFGRLLRCGEQSG